MRVYAVDPGTQKSALVDYQDGGVRDLHYLKNDEMLELLREREYGHLAIEMIASYGMPVGREVFETCVWIGRLIEGWGGPFTQVYRREVKMHLCGTPRAKDANVRQALLDRFGPGKELAVGTKKAPGPLYGVKGDLWAALGVAVTWADGN